MKITKVRGFTAFTLVVFCNSFVDLGHKILIQDTLYQTTQGHSFTVFSAIINALILLPYVLLFTPSGFLADKLSKVRLLRITAALAIPLTLLITWSYFQGLFKLAFFLTLLLATQSALNSPAKYGTIKELFKPEQLASANAWVQTLTIISILSATFLFTLLFSYCLNHHGLNESHQAGQLLQGFAPLGFLLIIISVIETWMTFRLPVKPASDPDSKYHLSHYFKGQQATTYLKQASKKPLVLKCIIGLSLFWAINQVLLASYGAYAKEFLNDASIIFVQSSLAAGGIGILFGATYAGYVSKQSIEKGIIPIACLGVTLGLFLLPHLQNKIVIILLFIAYGFFGGLLIVPLNALIQLHTENKQLGKTLAVNNFIQNVFMLLFLLLTALFSYYGLSSGYLLYGLSLIAFVSMCYAFKKTQRALVRFVLRIVTSRFYKIDIKGIENLSSEKGILLLGNHVSFIDWALLQIATPYPIRFVMERSIYEKWYFNWLLKRFKIIPIARGNSQQALEEINTALNNGEIVALFPEGCLTTNGKLGKFHSGFERAAKNATATIIPFYLGGLWGTKLSKAPKSTKKAKQTNKVSICFGQELDIHSSSDKVRAQVLSLSESSL